MGTLYDKLRVTADEMEAEFGKALIGIQANEATCRRLQDELPKDFYDVCGNPEFFRTLNHRGYLWDVTVKFDPKVPDDCLELVFGIPPQ